MYIFYKMVSDLFLLINGLSVGEKRLISISLAGGSSKKNSQHQIFDLVVAKKVKSDEELSKALKNVKNLSATKNQLFDKILDLLSSGINSFDVKYHQQYLKIETLFSRGLFRLALLQIRRLKKEVVKHERFYAIYELYLKEVKVLKAMTRFDEADQLIHGSMTDLELLSKEIIAFIKVHNQYHLINSYYSKNGASRSDLAAKEYEDFAFLVEQFEEQQLLKYSSQFYKNLGLLTTSFGLNDLDKCLEQTTELLAIFELTPHEREANLKQHLMVLHSHSEILSLNNMYQEFNLYIDYFKVLKPNSITEEIYIKERYFNLALNNMVQSAQFDNATILLDEFKYAYEEQNLKFNKDFESLLLGLCTSLTMNIGDFKQALRWNNKTQQLPYYKDLREDLQFASDLMELIIHFELKNFQLLEYRIIAFQKKMKRKEKKYLIEEILLTYLRKLLSAEISDRTKILKDLAVELEKIKDNPFEFALLKKFDFIKYFNQKVLSH